MSVYKYNYKKSNGFTIAELLIVIVIIAILATLIVVAYNGLQKNAGAAGLKSDLNQAAKQLEIEKIYSGVYPINTDSVKKSKGTSFQYTSNQSSYCLTASNTYADYFITNVNNIPQEGLCPGDTSLLSGAPAGPWDVGSIVVGMDHACAKISGTAYCWGADSNGQLGNDASLTNRSTPVAVNSTAWGGGAVDSISIGDVHTCALVSGNAYCWGADGFGQLGNDASLTNQPTPVAVNSTAWGGGAVDSIKLGGSHTCVIVSGNAYCWGADFKGQLGNDASLTTQPTAVAVNSTAWGGGIVSSIDPGGAHTCVTVSGNAYCWGDDSSGQLGNDASLTTQPTAVAVNSTAWGGASVSSISASDSNTCAISSGAAYCWGWDRYGQLGNDASLTDRPTPVAVDSTAWGGGIVSSISPGGAHTCAIVGGVAYCWGADNIGTLGNDASLTDQPTPVAVDSTAWGGASVNNISAGSDNTCAIVGGATYCWGWGGLGTIGDGILSTNKPTPVKVLNP